MAQDIGGHSTTPALASHPNTSTDLPKSLIRSQFEPNTIVSAWLSISIAGLLLCKDVTDWTLPTLILLIDATILQPPTDSLKSIDWGVPCQAFMERLDFTLWVKA